MKGDERIGTFCEKCRQVMCKCGEWDKYINELKAMNTFPIELPTDDEIEKQADSLFHPMSISKPYWVGGVCWMRDHIKSKMK